MREDLARIRPVLPKNSSVLFVNDAWNEDTLNPFYVVRLRYHDPEIVVDRMKEIHGRPVDPHAYTLVIDYCGKQYVEATGVGCPSMK